MPNVFGSSFLGLVLCFQVWVFACVWVCVPNVKGTLGKDSRAPTPPLVAADLYPLSLFYFFVFILFISLLVWFFVGLGLGHFRDWIFLCDIRIW